jgi:hypothetical protein
MRCRGAGRGGSTDAPEEEWPALGLRAFAPGETMTLTMRIEMVAVAGSEPRP